MIPKFPMYLKLEPGPESEPDPELVPEPRNWSLEPWIWKLRPGF